MKETLITFVRHGKNTAIKDGTTWRPGATLNGEGIRQAEKTGKFLRSVPFDIILASDMNRARQTAEIINKYQGNNKHFENICFHRELSEHDEIVYGRHGKDHVNKKIEAAKAKATVKFFKKVIRENKGKKILIVAHGNVIRACIGAALGFVLENSPEINIFNCSISTLGFKGTKLQSILHINSTGHYHKPNFKDKLETVKFISDYSELFDICSKDRPA